MTTAECIRDSIARDVQAKADAARWSAAGPLLEQACQEALDFTRNLRTPRDTAEAGQQVVRAVALIGTLTAALKAARKIEPYEPRTIEQECA